MYAEVLIEYKVKSLDKTFTYRVPNLLHSVLKVGMKVIVPFGKGDSKINGFVTKIKDSNEVEDVKEIIGITDYELVLNSELMELGKYLKETTLCTLISAYQTMLPSSLKIRTNKTDYKKYDTYIKLNKDIKEIKEYMASDKVTEPQLDILNTLLEEGNALKSRFSISSVNTLLKKGYITIERVLKYRIDKTDAIEYEDIELTSDQTKCFNEITSNLDKEMTYLIHGVTGSGKTEIYMHLIERVISEGKDAIMLVPEITLSAQIVNNFYKRFGSEVAILHSALSNGEKYDEYLKIYRGDAHIIVGTRSAVFAPVNNLGIIIIDEEQSDSYKQDNTPKYNAIDVAKFRSKYNKVPLILGSATPTYEAYARGLKGVYKLISLPKRINDFKLPTVKIVNMKEEMKKRNFLISDYLKAKIEDRLEKKEQIMLFLNRRGYSTLVSCDECGKTFKCPKCDITLTYHKSSNSLRCHYCGYCMKKPDVCPECKTGEIRTLGYGTEKLESVLQNMFPESRIIRMDADTTTKKGSHEKIIKAFKNEEYDILLGTQMIAKGLDFPKVSLVGILSADASLNIPDFRSGEKTYALLNQVAGRAGRSGLDSEVVVQTFDSENKTIKMLEYGNYIKNFQYEMSIRKILKYPPYYYLVSLKVCSRVYEDASIEATKVYKYLSDKVDKETIILGPTPAGVFRVNNVYRFQLVIKYRFDDNLFKILKEIDEHYIYNKSVYLDIDINPYNI